jgi:hypothetical protein
VLHKPEGTCYVVAQRCLYVPLQPLLVQSLLMYTLKQRLCLKIHNRLPLLQLVECLPTCLAPGEKPKYEPTTSGAHLVSRYAAVQNGFVKPAVAA